LLYYNYYRSFCNFVVSTATAFRANCSASLDIPVQTDAYSSTEAESKPRQSPVQSRIF